MGFSGGFFGVSRVFNGLSVDFLGVSMRFFYAVLCMSCLWVVYGFSRVFSRKTLENP